MTMLVVDQTWKLCEHYPQGVQAPFECEYCVTSESVGIIYVKNVDVFANSITVDVKVNNEED